MTKAIPNPHFLKAEKGKSLPQVIKHINQEKIDRYAEASGDFNPIHVDISFAEKTPLGGTIAHGMLILAYISQMMTTAFGQTWLSGGRLSVRFKTPARPGDTITVSGKIKTIEPEGNKTLVSCDVLCQNQTGETVIIGEAWVRLPDR